MLAVFPVVVGFGATGEERRGEVECPRGRGEGVDVERGGWIGERVAVGG